VLQAISELVEMLLFIVKLRISYRYRSVTALKQ
jgi:hypothetical protein